MRRLSGSAGERVVPTGLAGVRESGASGTPVVDTRAEQRWCYRRTSAEESRFRARSPSGRHHAHQRGKSTTRARPVTNLLGRAFTRSPDARRARAPPRRIRRLATASNGGHANASTVRHAASSCISRARSPTSPGAVRGDGRDSPPARSCDGSIVTSSALLCFTCQDLAGAAACSRILRGVRPAPWPARLAVALAVVAVLVPGCQGPGPPKADAPPHHLERGFRNLNPEYARPGLWTRWRFVIPRLLSSPRKASFPIVVNDGRALRESAERPP